REDVLGAHQATVKEGEAGNGHQDDEDGREQHPGGVAAVDGGESFGLLGEGGQREGEAGGRGGQDGRTLVLAHCISPRSSGSAASMSPWEIKPRAIRGEVN